MKHVSAICLILVALMLCACAHRTRAADGNGHANVNSHADIYTGYLIYATDNSANHTHNRSYTRSHAYSWPKGAGETVLA